ncbi:MAG: hypothetical protein IKG18_01990 [Atopobiaceae bacterium]|nr:hypothetical protein [Atopobiaceae bacterium]
MVGPYGRIRESAEALGLFLPEDEMAYLAERLDMGESELDAVGGVLSYLAERKRQNKVDMYLRMSRLPLKAPKTFDNFDFGRLRGTDCSAIERLPAMASDGQPLRAAQPGVHRARGRRQLCRFPSYVGKRAVGAGEATCRSLFTLHNSQDPLPSSLGVLATTIGGHMAGYTELHPLVESVLDELVRLRYWHRSGFHDCIFLLF